ncbi:FxsA family protein [Candidatus Neomarinimicrobiota bacterium]
MFGRLLLLFITVPLIEVLILIKLGSLFGFWPTILLVIGTGIIGAYLAKLYGLTIWNKIQQDLQAGKMPADKLIDGLLILIGGIVLLTPGLLTDLLGILLLIPYTRDFFKRFAKSKFKTMSEQQTTVFWQGKEYKNINE